MMVMSKRSENSCCMLQEYTLLTQRMLLNVSLWIARTRHKASAFGRKTKSSQYSTFKQLSSCLSEYRCVPWDLVNTQPVWEKKLVCALVYFPSLQPKVTFPLSPSASNAPTDNQVFKSDKKHTNCRWVPKRWTSGILQVTEELNFEKKEKNLKCLVHVLNGW